MCEGMQTRQGTSHEQTSGDGGAKHVWRHVRVFPRGTFSASASLEDSQPTSEEGKGEWRKKPTRILWKRLRRREGSTMRW